MKRCIPYFLSACIMICFFLLPENAFAQANQNTDSTSSYVKGITTGRAKTLATGVLGLIGLIIALRAKRRLAKNSDYRNGLVIAFVLSLVTIILSAIQLIASAGAVFGSGSGKAGAIVALFLGLIGTALSGLSLRKK